MERMDVLNKLQEIFQMVFDDDTIRIDEDTSSDDIEEWDSFSNMQMILAVEDMFSVKFSIEEVETFSSCGKIVDCITSKKM